MLASIRAVTACNHLVATNKAQACDDHPPGMARRVHTQTADQFSFSTLADAEQQQPQPSGESVSWTVHGGNAFTELVSLRRAQVKATSDSPPCQHRSHPSRSPWTAGSVRYACRSALNARSPVRPPGRWPAPPNESLTALRQHVYDRA